jgi:protein-S-isoprenylcysteine O-methyltransferase Ste14
MTWGFRLAFFTLLSVIFLYLTLKRPHAHRFYRFITFESVLALSLMNANVWFENPFSPVQIVSWIVLLGSIPLALHGFYILRTRGEPEGDIEKTTRLIESGAYRYIRHPLYGSLLLVGMGAFLKAPSWVGGILLALECVTAYLTAVAEERGNIVKFGEVYRSYMKRTKMFIPLIF